MKNRNSREKHLSTASNRLSGEEVELLANQMEGGDSAARDTLILSHTPLVRYLANIFASRSPGNLYEDLYQEGCIGLVEATQRYDYRKGVLFSSYASYYIVKHMKDFIRKQDLIILPEDTYYQLQHYFRLRYDYMRQKGRAPNINELSRELSLPKAKVEQLKNYAYSFVRIDQPAELRWEMKQSLPETLHSKLLPKDSSKRPVEDEVALAIGELDLVDLQVDLDKREEEILRRKLGLALAEPETFSVIAKDLGYSSECIRLIYHKAIEKIRLAAQDQGYTLESFPLS